MHVHLYNIHALKALGRYIIYKVTTYNTLRLEGARLPALVASGDVVRHSGTFLLYAVYIDPTLLDASIAGYRITSDRKVVIIRPLTYLFFNTLRSMEQSQHFTIGILEWKT